MGMAVTVACPKHYRPAADVLMLAQRYGDKFTLTNGPDEAARDADVLFTDVWVSMGMEREAEQRRRDFLLALRWMRPAWRWPSRTA